MVEKEHDTLIFLKMLLFLLLISAKTLMLASLELC